MMPFAIGNYIPDYTETLPVEVLMADSVKPPKCKPRINPPSTKPTATIHLTNLSSIPAKSALVAVSVLPRCRRKLPGH